MNKNTFKIGIIGNGFVGNAIYENIKKNTQVCVYDKNFVKSINSYEDTIASDFIFICLPTPMTDKEGGECNLSIIENFFKEIPEKTSGIFIIKSTVPIGTTSKIKNLRKDIKIVHNPEFLTAKNAIEDFKNSERNIIGGDLKDCLEVDKLLKFILPKAKNILVTCEESEAIKYFSNTYLATKVTYFNLVYDLCENFSLNYKNVIDGICSDTRIGYSHSLVPGLDGERGFGGTCFPKDINALIDTFEKNNLDSTILKEIWKYNKNIRKNWDWSDNLSAVYNKK